MSYTDLMTNERLNIEIVSMEKYGSFSSMFKHTQKNRASFRTRWSFPFP